MLNSTQRIKIFYILLLLFSLLFSSSTYAVKGDEIKVVAAIYKPFVYYENERLTGFDMDLLDLICRLNRLKYTIQIVSFQDALNMLREGRADVGIGAIYVTEERKRFIDFTTSYLKTGLVYVIRSDARWDRDISNKRIGVKRLATGENLAINLSKRFKNVAVISFESTEDSIKALLDGKVDIIINDYLNTESLMHERYRGKIKVKKGFAGFPELLTHDEIAIAISRKRPDLLKQFNASIKDIKRSRRLESILENWPSIHGLPDFKRYLSYMLFGVISTMLLLLFLFRYYRKKNVIRLLIDSEERYRAITENSPDAIITTNSMGFIVLINNSALRFFGYEREELMGKPVTVLMPEGCINEHNQGFERFLTTGRQRLIGNTYETMCKKKDGTEFPVEISLSTWQIKGQRFFTGIIRDLTERKRSEEKLIESEGRFRSIFENSPNPLLIQLSDGTIVLINRRFTEITGYTLNDVNTFDRLLERVFPVLTYREKVIDIYKETFIANKPTIQGEDIKITCSDGTVRVWNIQSSPISWGDKMAVLWVGRDVTEHRTLEEQLRQAQKMELIGRFTGGIAHDFNNYLTAITGFSQLALLQLEDHPARQDLENVLKAAEKASGLTTQLLAFSRRQILRPEVINLNNVIMDMTKMIRRIIGEDIELRTNLDRSLWNVKVDSGQMAQVIMNLVSNARDAMSEGGVLAISTANVVLDESYARKHVSVIPGEYVMMAIEDTGIGMTEEVKSRIFEPFFTTKELGKGTGLGLATVYGIVKQFGGYIWVYSEPNEGTTFKIYLPRTKEEISLTTTQEKVEGLPKGKEGILVVEDNREVREFISKVLKELGYNVYEASDGIEALEIINQGIIGIDLLLTDVMMPKLRGDRLAERIRENFPGTRVLFISGYADNIITSHGILKEGINYLQKPFTANALAQAVRKVLDS